MTILYYIQYIADMKQTTETVLERLLQETRRGNLTIAVMSRLRGRDHYGYSLQKELTELGLDINQDTLYPLLRRLEEQDLLESSWIVDGSRPRKYYRLSTLGDEVFDKLLVQWDELTNTIRSIVS